MKILKPRLSFLSLLVAVGLAGCATSPKSPDVSDAIRKALDQPPFKDVSVSQDRDKGVVTLGGHVAMDAAKSQAETIAKSIAGAQVVANQIAVITPGTEKDTKAVNSHLDSGIGNNLDAALIQNGLNDKVKYAVKTGVVTLTGEVDSQATRSQAASIAASVPNVQQVVNELQVKNQKATSQ